MEKNPLSDIISRACLDRSFREEFLRDPGAVLRASGIQVPEGVSINVVENTDEDIYVVLPTSLEDQPANWVAECRPAPGREVTSPALTMKWATDGLYLKGRLSSENAQLFHQEVEMARCNLLIDFGGVTFMGSAALAVLLAVQKRLSASGKQLYLCNMAPTIRGIFAVSGLEPFFQFITRDLKEIWWMTCPIV